MRILHTPDSSIPGSPAQPPQDTGRVDTLEKIATSILQRLQDLDERISTLEKSQVAAALPVSAPITPAEPPAPAPSPAHIASFTPPAPRARVEVDSEAIRKGLLTKMWTYLNDKAA